MPSTDRPDLAGLRYDHDGTARHHHDDQTGQPIWWLNCEQFGGEQRQHVHGHGSGVTLTGDRSPDGFAWLIERGQSMGQVPTVWLAAGDKWTTNAWLAWRFATREEAEAVIDARSGFAIPSHGDRFGVAVEHAFAGRPVAGEGLLVTGRDVHREWRDGMLSQGREVAPERMAWNTLDQRDRDLDNLIASRLAAPAQPIPDPLRPCPWCGHPPMCHAGPEGECVQSQSTKEPKA